MPRQWWVFFHYQALCWFCKGTRQQHASDFWGKHLVMGCIQRCLCLAEKMLSWHCRLTELVFPSAGHRNVFVGIHVPGSEPSGGSKGHHSNHHGHHSGHHGKRRYHRRHHLKSPSEPNRPGRQGTTSTIHLLWRCDNQTWVVIVT